MDTGFLEFFQNVSGNVLLAAAAFIGTLVLIITMHEAGHYAAARLFGVRVDRFSIGMGKEVTGFTDKKGMRWSIARWPVGGYIQIFGDVDPLKPEIRDPLTQQMRPLTPQETGVAFYNKPVWQRAVIIAAGPLVNFIFAFIVLAILFMAKGQVSTPPVVGAIGIGTAGQEAGFQLYDEILSINDKPVRRFEDVWNFTFYHTGVPYHFKVLRNGKIIELTAASRPTEYKDENGIHRAHGRLGATHLGALKISEITSLNGIDVRNNESKARQLLLSLLDRNLSLGLSLDRDKKTENIFKVFLPRETNRDLTAPRSKDYDKIYLVKSKETFYFRHGFFKSLEASADVITTSIGEGLKILGVLLTGGAKKDSLGGVAMMSNEAGQAAKSGFYTFSIFLAIFSIQIGFINLLPVPVLDGGYLLFLAYELCARKPLPVAVKDAALYLGLAFIFGIMIIANLNDLFQMTRP